MTRLIILAGAGSILAAGSALAQDLQPAPQPAEPPQPMQTAPMPPADPEPAAATDISDAEIASFTAAAIRIREERDESMDSDASRARAEAIIAEEGLDPARYSQIAQAAQDDPAVAMRVREAIAAQQGETGPEE